MSDKPAGAVHRRRTLIPHVVEVEAQLTAREWLRWRLALDYRNPLVMLGTGWALFSTIPALLSTTRGVSTSEVVHVMLSAPLSLFVAAMAIGFPARRALPHDAEHAASPFARGTARLRAGEDGIGLEGSGRRIDIPWDECARVVELSNVVVVDGGDRLIPIPKRALDGAQLSTLIGLAMAKQKLQPDTPLLRWGLFLLWPLLVVGLLMIWVVLAPPTRH